MRRCVLLLVLVLPLALQAQSQSAFTYQGTLLLDDQGISGQRDFEFSLWNAAQGGQQVGQTLNLSAVSLERGRFSVELDFGAESFNGEVRWLEIVVADQNDSVSLTPRQRITATPYALRSLTPTEDSLRLLSNLPAGSGFTINLNGLTEGDDLTLAAPLVLAQDFNEQGGIYQVRRVDEPLQLQRRLSNDPSWRNAYLGNFSGIDVQLTLGLPNQSEVRWSMTNALVTDW
ncbi:MAG: hypothetical protein AAGJ52_06650, partial [Pseudomonadota bacterium]